MLRLEDVHVYYGLSHIIQGVSLEVPEGGRVCLLGRNGVGKSTTIRAIMGLVPPRSGSIYFQGRSLVGLPPHVIAGMGIAYVHEDRRIFPDLTVEENLEVGLRIPHSRPAYFTSVAQLLERFPLLARLRSRLGGRLSGGEQQLLALARAVAGNPRLLLLDEPTKGLAPVVVQELVQSVRALNEEFGTTLLLAEQNLKFAFSVTDYAYVLEKGVVTFSGPVKELQERPDLQKQYLAV